MSLPTTGPISLAEIAAEFGGNAPYGLNEYYGAAVSVPTDGPLSFADFYGTRASYWYANAGFHYSEGIYAYNDRFEGSGAAIYFEPNGRLVWYGENGGATLRWTDDVSPAIGLNYEIRKNSNYNNSADALIEELLTDVQGVSRPWATLDQRFTVIEYDSSMRVNDDKDHYTAYQIRTKSTQAIVVQGWFKHRTQSKFEF